MPGIVTPGPRPNRRVTISVTPTQAGEGTPNHATPTTTHPMPGTPTTMGQTTPGQPRNHHRRARPFDEMDTPNTMGEGPGDLLSIPPHLPSKIERGGSRAVFLPEILGSYGAEISQISVTKKVTHAGGLLMPGPGRILDMR